MNIERIREALAAGPTPGEWFAVNDGTRGEPFMNVKAERISGRGPTHEVAICATGDSPQSMETANARYIAACHPEAIRALLDRLDAAEAENERMRAVVSALAFQASRDPFVSVGHWCEHGPCAAIIRDISNPNADHHGPDWTERDSEYLK